MVQRLCKIRSVLCNIIAFYDTRCCKQWHFYNTVINHPKKSLVNNDTCSKYTNFLSLRALLGRFLNISLNLCKFQ